MVCLTVGRLAFGLHSAERPLFAVQDGQQGLGQSEQVTEAVKPKINQVSSDLDNLWKQTHMGHDIIYQY